MPSFRDTLEAALKRILLKTGIRLLIVLILLSLVGINLVPIWLVLPVVAYFVLDYQYKKTTYYQITKCPYVYMLSDTGRRGEYLTYKKLQCFEKDGARFLFNCQLWKNDRETTEIDIIMIDRSGVYVFESKKSLTPVRQNELHINCLKKIIGDHVKTHSIIVASDQDELQRISAKPGSQIRILLRAQVKDAVGAYRVAYANTIPESLVAEIYANLYSTMQVTE